MSDPVTNVDIEDVLSSIRRLVREGGGTASQAVSPASVQTTPPPRTPAQVIGDAAKFSSPPPGRFVLTPALRVAEKTPEPDVQPAPVEDILPQTGPAADNAFDLPAAEDEISDFVTEEPAVVPTLADPEPRPRASDRAAGLEVAVTARTGEWEPDGSEDVPVMDWAQTIAEDAPIFRSRQAHPLRPNVTAAAHDTGMAQTPFHRDPVEITPVDPALLSADSDPERLSGSTDAAGPGLRDDFAAYLGSKETIDEAALRALIVQIVHEELQGSLGERITRNVRKLVRREINRMVVSDDLD